MTAPNRWFSARASSCVCRPLRPRGDVSATAPTIHASAVLVGSCGILIRGPSRSGKSSLAWSLLHSGGAGFSRLLGDDRIHLEAAHGRLLMRPAPALAGLIEVRGVGIVRLPYEPLAVVSLVVDLGVTDAQRLPQKTELKTTIEGVVLTRLPVAPAVDQLAKISALLVADSAI